MSHSPERPTRLLVVVPCGKAKIWARNVQAGPTAAADAYIGAPFIVNGRYAEQRGGDWLILSAKHRFLRPYEMIPGPYETTSIAGLPTRSVRKHCASKLSVWV